MSNSVRMIVLVLFVAAMIGWRFAVHQVADAGGIFALLVLIAGILWFSVWLTNRERKAAKLPAVTMAEARSEMGWPLAILALTLIVAAFLR